MKRCWLLLCLFLLVSCAAPEQLENPPELAGHWKLVSLTVNGETETAFPEVLFELEENGCGHKSLNGSPALSFDYIAYGETLLLVNVKDAAGESQEDLRSSYTLIQNCLTVVTELDGLRETAVLERITE